MTVTVPRVWLITGTSSGFGESLVKVALARGDLVIATARNLTANDHLKQLGAKTLHLDVTASQEELDKTAEAAIAIYGRVDVLVNNAGYALLGTIEESTNEEVLKQFNTNVFGLLAVTRAFLPHMRARKSGTIIQIGSVVGHWSIGAIGIYAATKHAVAALSDALADEVKDLGIRVTNIEPATFRTAITVPERQNVVEKVIPGAYDHVHSGSIAHFKNMRGTEVGDSDKAAERIVDIVKGEGYAKGKEWPTKVLLGSDALPSVRAAIDTYIKSVDEWEELTLSTDLAK